MNSELGSKLRLELKTYILKHAKGTAWLSKKTGIPAYRIRGLFTSRGKKKELNTICSIIEALQGNLSLTLDPDAQWWTTGDVKKNLIPNGTRFGQRVVIDAMPKDFYQVQCDCGKINNVRGHSLKSGSANKCKGCGQKGKSMPKVAINVERKMDKKYEELNKQIGDLKEFINQLLK